MTTQGTHTFHEIMSQPTVWAETLATFADQIVTFDEHWQANNGVQQAIFTGCGSTHYLSMTAAALFQTMTKIPSQARPASELVLFPERIYLPDTTPLLVTISRSGETTETIDAVHVFKRHVNGHVLAITCDDTSKLAQQADTNLSANAAQEESIAQTRSFASMMVLVEAFAAHVTGLDAANTLAPLAEHCGQLLTDYGDLAQALGENMDIQRFFFLGTSYMHGIANEAMLKMKEMSLAYSEAFHTLEFRHGPMSMVNDHTLIVGLLSETAQAHEIAVLEQMHARGARILAISESGSGLPQSERISEVILKSGLPAWARTILYLPVLQLMAYYRALANGQDPDHPANLDAVIVLSSLFEA
jgi:glucosamine--fructose-6-phosphate aminotransferase (isomerizing)